MNRLNNVTRARNSLKIRRTYPQYLRLAPLFGTSMNRFVVRMVLPRNISTGVGVQSLATGNLRAVMANCGQSSLRRLLL